MLPFFTMLAILASGTMTMQMPHESDQPIVLETRHQPGSVELLVVGDASEAVVARYRLEVSGGAGGNRNKTVQAGSATLKPGDRKVLLRLTLGDQAGSDWNARLTVERESGASYAITSEG